jgi:hypothetical protein
MLLDVRTLTRGIKGEHAAATPWNVERADGTSRRCLTEVVIEREIMKPGWE